MVDVAELPGLFARLGVRRGGVLMVHSSLHGSGLRDTDVRDALLDALGPHGTLVVPAFTSENSDTSSAHREIVAGMTDREVVAYRQSMPPFDPDASPCVSMGVLAECVRTTPGARRSAHPQSSFAALGARARELMADHDPHCHLGERSPLAALYETDAQVLLFRVGFEVCTAFHLAEYRMVPPPPSRLYRCVVETKGNWITYEDLTLNDDDFAEVGAALPRELIAEGEVAEKPVMVFGMRAAVDHARRALTGIRR
ncbi:aminoglycoside N(3)-acetyltransferase [Streptomyces yaanensis]|uniref:Aminoglycoside N(3)-acetyltransferase n=1 Tax=Streptomyces yaanensis TaxID=1142239 RepID=A0ABV7SIE5_9ACTN|nr:AAC(3) family N-acetyltransferase [Streptomyces sp. CGMCC 4.7035]WNC01682.1 AAC(3) family N-acetyltransferase [Streptomyces sp. CGMCC 4.7035]